MARKIETLWVSKIVKSPMTPVTSEKALCALVQTTNNIWSEHQNDFLEKISQWKKPNYFAFMNMDPFQLLIRQYKWILCWNRTAESNQIIVEKLPL